MSNLRDEMKLIMDMNYDGDPLIDRQAKRILLLDKSYRLQRAAWQLMNMAKQLLGDDRRWVFFSKSLTYDLKASQAHEQAKEL